MKSEDASARYATVFVLLSILFLGGACAASAQVSTGTLLGVVKDASGAVVAGTTITARNIETNLSRTFTTAEDGAYRIPALPTGPYELRAEHEGFQTEIRTGLTLTVSQEEAVNFTLQIGSTQQTVSVTGEAALVNTSSSTVGGTVNQEILVDLPLNGRSYEDLTMLQPGVSDNKNQNNANRGSSGHYFSSNGAQVRSNNYYLDGTSLVNPYGASSSSIAQTTLGVDGIQEYRVITSGIPAELGMVMGSQMLMVSRGGTNAFHGDAFEFLRNSVLDAKNFFDVSSIIGKRLPEYQRNQFGGAFGGPVKKDKMFFYITYEGLRENKGITTVTSDLPAATDAFGNPIAGGACRGAAGDTIKSGLGIGQCALLGVTPGTSAVVAGAVPGVSSSMAPFLSTALYPLPNLVTPATATTGPVTNLTFQYSQPSIEDYGQARLDYNLSSHDTVFARYTADYATQNQVQPYPEYVANLDTIGEYVTLGENHIFSSALLNTLRTSFSRSNIGEATVIAPGLNISTYINTTPGSAVSLEPGYPTGGVSVAGSPFAGAAAASGPLVRQQNIYAVQDDINYTRGKHSMKFGVLFNIYQQFATADASIKGTAAFSSFSNYVKGLYQTLGANLAGSNLARTIDYKTLGLYAQDDWRITSRLTLNLGLRYEIETMPHEKFGQWSAFINPATDPEIVNGEPAMPITPGGRLFAKNPSLRNFGPRVGFAWDVFGNGKTSVRGAYDLLYDIGDYESITLQTTAGQPPISERGNVGPLSASCQVSPLLIPFTNATFAASACNPGNLASLPRPMDYYFKQPYLHLYNLTIDRQLPWSSVLTVSYVGSRGYHLPDDADGNPEIPQGIPGSVNGAEACVARPAGQTANYTSMMDGNATACWLGGASGAVQCSATILTNCNPRVNQNWGSWSDTYTSRGDSWYNSLQVGFTKRLTNGLQAQFSYTWASSIDNNPGQLNPDQNGTSILNMVNPINMNDDRGPSSTDIPNNLKVNVLYYLPNVKSDNMFAKGFLNGWWVSGIFTSLSGFPFSPVLGTARSNSGVDNSPAGLDRPDWVPGFAGKNITSATSAGCTGVPAGTPLGTTANWYDPCAFQLQPQGFIGNVGRDSVRGPDFRDLDFSIVKDTSAKFLGEAGKFEFRTEFFNALNRGKNWALPGRTVETGALSSAAGLISPTGTTTRQITGMVGTPRQIQFALKILF